jgi:hypothetical protein
MVMPMRHHHCVFIYQINQKIYLNIVLILGTERAQLPLPLMQN